MSQSRGTTVELSAGALGLLVLVWVVVLPIGAKKTASVGNGPKATKKNGVGKGESKKKERKGKSKRPSNGGSSVSHTAHWTGPGACAKCHPRIAAQAATSKGLFRSANEAERVERSGKAQNHLGDFAILRFHSTIKDNDVFHRVSVNGKRGGLLIDQSMKAKWVLGGKLVRYYFVNDQLQTSPIYWYGKTSQWVASGTTFETPLSARCKSCHLARAKTAPSRTSPISTLAKFELKSVSCEGCHGPSGKHVADAKNHNGFRPNWYSCVFCHVPPGSRIPESGKSIADFYPGGQRLADLFNVSLRHWDSVPHGPVAEMIQSRCFKDSQGQLSCMTCHDPHQAHNKKASVQHYRQKCMSCHQGTGGTKNCKLTIADRRKKQPNDSCIACHMPERIGIRGTHGYGRNHRIVRSVNEGYSPIDGVPSWWKKLIGGSLSKDSQRRARMLRLSSGWTAPATIDSCIDKDPTVSLPIPYGRLIDPIARRNRKATVQAILELIETSRKMRNGFDRELLTFEAVCLLVAGQPDKAAKTLQQLTTRDKTDGWLFALQGMAWERAKDAKLAAMAAERAVKLLPGRSGPLLLLARIKIARKQTADGIKLAERSMAIHPRRWSTRRLLRDAYRKAGDLPKARRMEALLKRIGKEKPGP